MEQKKLEQGTQEWLDFRKNKIGASDAPCIMGVGYHTPYKLWQTKLGMTEIKQNQAMARGHELEPVIRNEFELMMGVNVEPEMIINPEVSWMIASLDGLNREEKIAVEIKNNNKEYHEMAKDSKIPARHYPQLQHQIACLDHLGIHEVHYYSHWNGEYAHVIEKRCDQYIDDLKEKESQFFECMMNLTPPEMTEADYIKRTDEKWSMYARAYREACTQLKHWEEECKSIKQELVSKSDGQSCKGEGVTLRLIPPGKGRVNYNKIPELCNVDLDLYRTPSKEIWRLSVDKQ